DILSEARKYKLNLIIAHQYIEQMEEEVRDAVFGNVGTTISFRVGPFDAEVLETIFQPVFMATDLVNLGFAQIYLTLMIDGVGSPPFSASTLPPFDPPPQRFVSEVIQNSRAQFGMPRAQVEQIIQDIQDKNPLVIEAPKPKTAYTRTPASAPPFAPPKMVSSEKRHMEAKAIGNTVAREHAMAAAADTPARPPSKPSADKPPLPGAKSLREALAQVTGEKPQVHAPDLKETLRTVAPQAPAPAEPAPRAPLSHPHTIAELPPEELRSMLSVDETWDDEMP
ncbi:MAG: hypothetical protein KGH79_05135, partial [Patescibacteria group bacterium]|nr:hypothetical protein [Patescibacteria group bacterium]